MIIHFLGTSDGYPEPDRYCSCTAVEVNGKLYIIDAGMALYSALMHNGFRPDAVKGIFITHNHGDHASGLVEYINLMSWGYRFKLDPDIFVPTKMLKETLLALSYTMDDAREVTTMSVYSEGKVFEDENVKVTAFRTSHTNASFGFYIEGDGKKVYFTGDLDGQLNDLPEFLFKEKTDIVICESAHNKLNKVTDKFNALKTDRVIINHMSSEHTYEEFDLAKPVINKPFEMAFDGMKIEL